jgi:arsenate reductase
VPDAPARRRYNVLFLCTGNSARSIIAESVLRKLGGDHFRAFSAGSHPKGAVHPLALELLAGNGLSTDGLRSKPWDEFASADAPKLDFVFTVCDNAAGEVCPVWPGQPVTAHWGVPDPAEAPGNDEARRRAFSNACHMLTNRIRLFTSLPLERLDRAAMQSEVRRIGDGGV